jgi:hypothetical protein
MRLNETEKQFVRWISYSWSWRNRGDHKERNVLMFWSKKMKALGIDEEELWWYLDTRRFGSAFTLVLD